MSKSTNKAHDIRSLAAISTYQSGIVQSKAHRQLHKHIAACLAEHGLTPMQWFMAGAIYDAGEHGVQMSHLAKELGITLATLNASVALLEAKGVISKKMHARDARAKVVYLDESFAPKLASIEKDLRQKLRGSLYDSIAPDELLIYIRVLYKLAHL